MALDYTRTLAVCPACDQKIIATLSTEKVGEDETLNESGTVKLTFALTGLRVNHDCVPRTKRSGEMGSE